MAQETAIPLQIPFKNIALALSGGGFRAASFSLGTLSYLEHLKLEVDESGNATTDSLLDHVTFMSSASGGTITASFYSLLRSKAVPFGDIYKKLLGLLSGDQVLSMALQKLNNDAEWDAPANFKKRNLINAFAKAYDELIFAGEKFGAYSDPGSKKNFEVCFNATEFRRGLSFRFQTDGNAVYFALIGNKFIHFNNKSADTYKNIKLGDVLAASACFPSGFEPIMFPEDFSYRSSDAQLTPGDLRKALLVEHYNKEETELDPSESIGLMDGGVADNQGLESALLADNRRKDNYRFDLIIVADVASYFMDAYKVPVEQTGSSWQQKTLGDYISKVKKICASLNAFFTGSLLLLLISLIVIFTVKQPLLHSVAYFTLGFSALSTIILALLLRIKKRLGLSQLLNPTFKVNDFLKKRVPPIKNFSDTVIDKLVSFFKGTKLGVLQQMLSARLSSVLSMVSDVNLKQVRRLIFSEFYANDKWNDRRCPNFIYELSKQNVESRKKILDDYVNKNVLTQQDVVMLRASPKIESVAEQARLVGTTLWFDTENNDTLKKVVSCGQFSTCVNLLQYVLALECNSQLEFSQPVKDMLTRIKGKLIADWQQFKDNPCYLFEFYEKDK